MEQLNVNVVQQIVKIEVDGEVRGIVGNGYEIKRILVSLEQAGSTVTVLARVLHSGRYRVKKLLGGIE